MPYIAAAQCTGPRKEAAGGIPGRIDAASLTDLKTIAGIRKQCLMKLAEPLSLPAMSSYSVASELGQHATSPDRLLHISTVQAGAVECSPDENTPNSIIKIGVENGPGTLDVAFSPALGWRWRLSADHPVAAAHPQLTQFEMPEPKEAVHMPGEVYVASRDLETAMLSVSDTGGMNEDLLRFLQSLGPYKLKTTTSHVYDGRWPNMKQGEGFSAFGIDAYPANYDFTGMKYGNLLASLKFLLHSNGLKIVDIATPKTPEAMDEGPDRDLVQTAHDLSWQNRLYMESEKPTS